MALVQHVIAESGAAVNFVDIPISAAGAGNLLVVATGNGSSFTVVSVSDGTLAFTQVPGCYIDQSNRTTDVWYLRGATAGATSIRVTFSSAVGAQKVAAAWEVSGLPLATVDGAANASSASTATSTITGGTATAAAGAGFAVGVVVASFAISENPKAGNEFSAGGDIDSDSLTAMCSLVHSAAGGHTPEWLAGISGVVFASSTACFRGSDLAAFIGEPPCGSSTIGP